MTLELLACACIALASSLAMLALRLRAPLGADEGYLWYGVQQLLKGRVPHRDFKAYEPGRYLWSALLARVFGPGLHVLRWSTHLFFALGLFASLVVLRRLGLDWTTTAVAAATLAAWSHPQHKQFEHGAMLFAWAAATHALLAPTPANLAIAGATAGLALLFGFNLFLYFGAAFALVFVAACAMGWLAPGGASLLAVAGGGLAGMAPFLLMLLSPGVRQRFFERRIGGVLSRGSANLPLPLPWPWRPIPHHLMGFDAARRRAFQGVFALLFVVPVVALALVLAGPVPPALARGLLAAAALGVLVGHHAASRADAAHIAQAIAPLCLLAILLTSTSAPAGTFAIAVFSLWLAWPLQGRVPRQAPPEAFSQRVVGGLRIHLPSPQARLFDAAASLSAARPDDRAGLLALPLYPALYAALSRDAPVYDTFCVYPAGDRAQQEMIESIDRAAVFAALVSDSPLDGREDLRFSHTHPRVWAHLCERMQRSPRPDLGQDVHGFTAPDFTGAGAVARAGVVVDAAQAAKRLA